MIIWLNGPAGSGKTTLAKSLTKALLERHIRAIWLDGDEVRKWLTPDCGFSDEDRAKHLARVFRVAQLLSIGGAWVVCSFVGLPPEPANFHVYLEGRGRSPWPGTSYPRPECPDIVLDTGRKGKKKCLEEILDALLLF